MSTLLEDTVSVLWLPSLVMNTILQKDPILQFAKTQESGVNSHQNAMQVIKLEINN